MSLNDYIYVLKEEIKRIEWDLGLLNMFKNSNNINSQNNTESIISNEERLNKLQKQLDNIKSNKDYSIKMYCMKKQIKNEIANIIREQSHHDSETDYFGDLKTKIEKEILKFSNYKRNCLDLIETIESKIESPEDDATTEKDIKSQLKKLNDQVISLFDDQNIGNKYILKNRNPIAKFIRNGYNLKGIQFKDEAPCDIDTHSLGYK